MNTNKQTGDTTMNESYKDKFNATMKQFGIDSLDDLKSNEEKKEFFKAVDIANNAVNEAFGPLNRRHTSARVFTDKNKAQQIMKFLSDNGEKYPVAIDDNGSGGITLDDDGQKGSSYDAGMAIAKRFRVGVMGESYGVSTTDELMAIAEEMKEGGPGSGPQGNPQFGKRKFGSNKKTGPIAKALGKIFKKKAPAKLDYKRMDTTSGDDFESDEFGDIGEMMKEMMKEMAEMAEMKMLKAETDPTKVEMMKKEMMKEMMKEMAEMSDMPETMKKEMMKEMSKKMNEYGSMNIVAMKEELTAGQKKLPPALQKAIAAKSDKKETVSPAQQAAIAISKKEKKEELEEKHVPDHQETAVNAMAMNAMRKETARKEMMVKAMKMPIRAMKTGDDDMTPDALKLNAMIKDPHKSREEDPKKDLNATYMTSDVRADVKNGGGTDMSKVQDAPKMMAAMKKISAMYKTEKYHDTKPGSLNDTLAEMHLNEHKTVLIKVQEFSALVETYLAKGGVLNNLTAGIQEVELNKTLKLREAREFITTYNRHFMTNYKTEEFIKEDELEG